MNTKSQRRGAPIAVNELERRTLLTAPLPTATWIGQDGHDLVGPYSSPSPDEVQDIHVALAGLPADRTIIRANITGYQGSQWQYNGPPDGPWAAAMVQSPGATTADLYLEPDRVETGRYFFIDLTFDDQSTAFLSFLGGTANPNLRMPGEAVAARWLGQDGHDWTGPGPAVGPDGFQDAHLALSNLSSTIAITSATLTASGGATWAFGTNPALLPDAELIPQPGDPTRADFDFSPGTNLDGQTLTMTLNYADGKTDSTSIVAGPTDPTLRMPTPSPVAIAENAFTARWVGQDGQDLTGPGDVQLTLSGLPAGHSVTSAQLTDGTRNSWDYVSPGATLSDANPNALPLAFRPSATDPTRADVDFPPIRDESNTTLTLRLVLDDGTNLVTTFAGGSADPGLRAPGIAATSAVAHPGDDLNMLANQYGTVHLTAGTYNLPAPLVLDQPVTITADPGTTLLFAQGPGDPTWTAAIKINAAHTTLSGFAVRFAGPIRWTDGINYGPAVIGTTDNFDTGPDRLKVDITLTGLDLESPPSASAWEAAPSLIRVVSALDGAITNNTLKGGTTEFLGGPWQVVGNTYRGTVPNTYTSSAFAGHYTHDVVIANNQVEPVGPSGKTYRFLVLTQGGIGDVVQGNNVVGVGPMDSDTEPNPNASEVVLTEAYRLAFEGAPASIAPDGRIVQVSGVQAGAVVAGDVLAILAGPQAGQWRLISQVINPTTFLLASPIDPGATAISIATGFVNESFVGNTIDTRGSSTASDLVLAGNQFGVQVLNNHLIGGNRAFWITAYPSETPGIWGWTHAPVLGATISGNTIEDSAEGGILDVEHNAAIKTNVGRVYLTATLTDNTGVWTEPFLAQPAQAAAGAQLQALTVGMAPSNDPGELVVKIAGNQVEGPANVVSGATLLTVSALVNGQSQSNQGTNLPAVAIAAPTGLALVSDTGDSANDGQTGDAHLRFDPVPWAVGYESSLTGAAGSYQPVSSPASFLPQGLAAGFDTVYVRALDAAGNRGPDALILFAYDPDAAGTPPGSGSSRIVRYEYRIGDAGAYVPLGMSLILTPAQEANGPIALQIQQVEPRGPGTPISAPPSSPPRTGDQPPPASTPSGPDPQGQSPGGSPVDPGQSPPPVDVPGAPPSGASGEGVAMPMAPWAPPVTSTTDEGSSTTQLLTPPTVSFNPMSGDDAATKSAAIAGKITHGPRWARHPNPFRKAPTIHAPIRILSHSTGHRVRHPLLKHPALPHRAASPLSALRRSRGR